MSFLLFLLGFTTGWFALQYFIAYKVKRMLNSIDTQANLPPVRKVINIDFYKYKDRIYAYNRDTQAFLVHGETREEIATYLNKHYPDTNFMANPVNLKDVGL
jgi:hypothetical protein